MSLEYSVLYNRRHFDVNYSDVRDRESLTYQNRTTSDLYFCT